MTYIGWSFSGRLSAARGLMVGAAVAVLGVVLSAGCGGEPPEGGAEVTVSTAALDSTIAAGSSTTTVVVVGTDGGTPPTDQDSTKTNSIVFTSVSNVLKTRHDTAKNSISN